jgi:hydantoinase/carbamoylase family amidase
MSVDPRRTIAELRELHALTGDADGAQRLAFTQNWAIARAWLCAKLAAVPLEVHTDAAGNLWATLAGADPRALLIGGHIDSVPNGGWLDGCLNTLAGLEIIRRLHAQYGGLPPLTVRLVDWADEEGARFGRSLFGSSACSGSLDLEAVRGLRDHAGVRLPGALHEHGIDFDRIKDSARELRSAAAYLELHIEQGPVLLDLGLPLGAVLGTFGVERHAITFYGEAAHSGSTPMNRRRDAFLAAAQMAPAIYEIAARHGGVGTIGSCVTLPGIPTSVVAECRLTLDQRHLEAEPLARMLAEARAAAATFTQTGNVTVHWEPLVQIAPVHFDNRLVTLCDEAIRETAGGSHHLPSGPLHDAAEMAQAGVPTAMMFVQSLHGISHNRMEDTRAEHLELAITAFDRLVDKTIGWLMKAHSASAAM